LKGKKPFKITDSVFIFLSDKKQRINFFVKKKQGKNLKIKKVGGKKIIKLGLILTESPREPFELLEKTY